MSFQRNVSHTFITSICNLVIGIGTSVYVARHLGPEMNGKLALVMTIPVFLFMFGNFGVGSALSYYTAREEYPLSEILNVAFLSTALLALVAAAAFFASYPLHSGLWENIDFYLIAVAVALTPLSLLDNFIHRIILGRHRITLVNNVTTVSAVAKIILIFVLFLVRADIGSVVAASCISLLLGNLLLLFSVVKEVKLGPVNFSLFRACFKYGINVYLLFLVSYLNLRCDLYFLKHLLKDDAAVGYYSIAVGIAEMLWLLPDSIVKVLFPSIVASANSKEGVDRTISSLKWNMVVMIVGSIGAIAFAKYALLLLYGESYLPSYKPLLYLLPGVAIYPVFKILAVDISARGRPGYASMISVAGFAVNAVSNILLIPIMGLIGASVSSSISYTLMSVLALCAFCKIVRTQVADPDRKEVVALKEVQS